MKPLWTRVGFIGMFCSTLCVLGLPLLLAWLPAMNWGWLRHDGWFRGMLVMFLGMYGVGVLGAFRRHRRPGPVILAAIGVPLLVGTVWHVAPQPVGWLAFALFAGAWWWNAQLLKTVHHGH